MCHVLEKDDGMGEEILEEEDEYDEYNHNDNDYEVD